MGLAMFCDSCSPDRNALHMKSRPKGLTINAADAARVTHGQRVTDQPCAGPASVMRSAELLQHGAAGAECKCCNGEGGIGGADRRERAPAQQEEIRMVMASLVGIDDGACRIMTHAIGAHDMPCAEDVA